MAGDLERSFSMFIPISKSTQAEDGSIIHHGLASDQSLDLDDDTIPADFFQKSLPFLNQWGKFNWNHGNTEIGDVTEARIVTPEEACELLGPNVKMVKKALYVKGTLYPIVDAELAPPDLKKAHHALRSGMKLGYSVQGVQRRNNGKMQGAFATKIALAPQPVNLNTVCVLAKSLREVFAEIPDDDDRPVEVVYPQVVGEFEVLAKKLEREVTDAEAEAMVTVSLALWKALVKKTLEASSGPGVGSVGGRALGKESLDRRIHSPILGGRGADRKRELKKGKKGKKPPLGTGERFAEVEAEAKRSGARNPAAVAAAAGRKKYGKKRFQELAVAGRQPLKKGRRKAHPRKLESGKVAQVRETTTKVPAASDKVTRRKQTLREQGIVPGVRVHFRDRMSGSTQTVTVHRILDDGQWTYMKARELPTGGYGGPRELMTQNPEIISVEK